MKNNICVLVGFGGKAGVGKTTLANSLVKHYNLNSKDVRAISLSFAGPVKRIVHTMLYDIYKGKKEKELDLSDKTKKIYNNKTLRWFYQTIGTDWGRKLIGEDIWVDSVRGRIEQEKNNNKNLKLILIHDVRFPNEMKLLKQYNGISIYLNRDVNTIQENAHSSENSVTEADFDTVFHSGSKEKWVALAKQLIDKK